MALKRMPIKVMTVVTRTVLVISQMFLLFIVAESSLAQVSEQDSRTINSASIKQNMKPQVEYRQRAIEADLVDQGDYYYHPDGREIRMLRKKDVYVVDNNFTQASGNIKTLYGDRVEVVDSVNLLGRTVVKVDNSQATKQRLNQAYDVSAQMLAAMHDELDELQPVFANSRGEGDILLSPKLTLKLVDGANTSQALTRLSRQYNLRLDRKLRLSGEVYSFALVNDLSETQQFALVRSVMEDMGVEWAEPQFVSKPYKTEFIPTGNALFSDQWHLRNIGYEGSRCDTDCDATDAWDIGDVDGVGAVAGDGMVIAIIDDGVQLDHEDLAIWSNPGETLNGGDSDANGYVDDINGWDFVDETDNGLQNTNASGPCLDGDDGVVGQDNDPSPQATTDCITINGDDVEQDDHGTAVAGIAAAIGTNTEGVVGTAFRAEILPIRLISEFDGGDEFCIRAAEAMEYAGRYADVVNNSWGMDVTCSALETAITNVTTGVVMDGMVNVSKRANGSPVLFASGNDASGWVKVTIPVSAGEHAYEWRFLRSAFPDIDGTDDADSAWLDDITWPDATTEDFESGTLASIGFDTDNVLAGDSCTAQCTSFLLTEFGFWDIDDSPEPIFGGTKAARVDASDSDCGNTYLYEFREELVAGDLSFWVWVDTDTSGDKFEFLIDGKEVLSFGDFPTFIGNSVGYPANLSTTIAVGASDSGDLSGTTTVDMTKEKRAFYSQYGSSLDVLAPSSGQQLGILTTDREGLDGYNDGGEGINNNYTNSFGGTSAATPIVSGIAAAMLATDQDLTAADVRSLLRQSANKVGSEAYDQSTSDGSRNNFYGYGRVNMYRALLAAAGQAIVDPAGVPGCFPLVGSFNYTSADDIFTPVSGEFCPAVGSLPQTEELCLPIKTTNGAVVVICL